MHTYVQAVKAAEDATQAAQHRCIITKLGRSGIKA